MIVILLSFTILNISSQVSTQKQESSCNIISKNLNSKQASQFEYNLNTIRNQVAMGRRANHKGQIQPASDMHIATWSQELAKLAQECSETCPEHPLYCRHYKAQQAFLIYKQPVHTDKWNIDPDLILNEWMQSKQTSQQLLQSMLFQIGCGRAVNSNLGEYVVYVVCYFDYPNQQEPYRPSSSLNVANSCRLGRSSSYTALCTSPYQKEQGLMQLTRRHRESVSK